MVKIEPELLIMGVGLLVLCILGIVIYYWKRYRKKKEKFRHRYPSWYICTDRHKVRSLSEYMVDEFFSRNGIRHEYEDVILKSVEKKYKYDWYLPECDVYVEFFGYSGKRYHQNTLDKIDFYRKHSLTMIALYPNDLADSSQTLLEKFQEYWVKIAHRPHCPSCGKMLDERLNS